MNARYERLPDDIDYWSVRAVQAQTDQRESLIRDHIKRTQMRFGQFMAALIGVFLLSLILESVRSLVGGKTISIWRCLTGIVPGLMSLAAVLIISIAFVKEVYETPIWHAALDQVWLLLFGRAPSSLLDLTIPARYPFAPYPSIIVQQGRIDEKHENTFLVRFGGPGNVIIFNDSAVFLEQFGRFTRVAGPGAVFLQRFERIHETFDLRPHERGDTVTALTRDGIAVKTEVQVRLQLACPPTSKAPPTPDIPHPFYKQALIRAGQCHLHSVNMDSGAGSIARWAERASGVGGTLRALIAQYRLDALLEAGEPERDPRGDIAKQLCNKLDTSARDYGAQILKVRLGAPEPTLEEVRKTRITSWQAAWKSEARKEKALGIAEAIRERGLARAYAQVEIILALTREFQELVKRDATLSAEFIALRFIEALRQTWALPGGMVMSAEAVHTLDSLQRMVRRDYALSANRTGSG
jgi:hypothetical protein